LSSDSRFFLHAAPVAAGTMPSSSISREIASSANAVAHMPMSPASASCSSRPGRSAPGCFMPFLAGWAMASYYRATGPRRSKSARIARPTVPAIPVSRVGCACACTCPLGLIISRTSSRGMLLGEAADTSRHSAAGYDRQQGLGGVGSVVQPIQVCPAALEDHQQVVAGWVERPR
jgi:hypothetical protein